MINPTEKDIGRRVVYTPLRGPKQYGTITYFNETHVFVLWDDGTRIKTDRADLTWEREGV